MISVLLCFPMLRSSFFLLLDDFIRLHQALYDGIHIGHRTHAQLIRQAIEVQAGSTGVIQSIFDERGSVLYTYSVTINYQRQHTACYAM